MKDVFAFVITAFWAYGMGIDEGSAMWASDFGAGDKLEVSSP